MNAIIKPTMFNRDVGTAWSGVRTIDAQTASEAVRLAGLNWEVRVEPTYLANGAKLPKSNAIVRVDNGEVLGVVGNSYTPVQNEESLTFFDKIKANMPGMRYVSAGSVNQGKRVWLLADFGGFDAQGGDEIRKQVLLYNSHDGSSSLSYMFVPNRVFCNNQIAMILKSEKLLKVRHSASAHRVFEIAKGIAEQAVRQYDQVEGVYKALVNRPLTSDLINITLDSLYPLTTEGEPVEGRTLTRRTRVRAEIQNLIDEGMGQQKRNGFTIYNAFSEHLTHHVQVNKGGGQERRWENNVWGKGVRDMRTVTQAILAA